MSGTARLLRQVQRARAWCGGYFWLPCNLCGEYTGGHEWRDVDGKPSSVRCRARQSTGHGICRDCTAAGLGETGYQGSTTEHCPYCGRDPE